MIPDRSKHDSEPIALSFNAPRSLLQQTYDKLDAAVLEACRWQDPSPHSPIPESAFPADRLARGDEALEPNLLQAVIA